VIARVAIKRQSKNSWQTGASAASGHISDRPHRIADAKRKAESIAGAVSAQAMGIASRRCGDARHEAELSEQVIAVKTTASTTGRPNWFEVYTLIFSTGKTFIASSITADFHLNFTVRNASKNKYFFWEKFCSA